MTVKITFKDFTKKFDNDVDNRKNLQVGCHLAFKQWAKSNHIKYKQYTVEVDDPYYEFDDPMDLVKLKLELNREFVRNWWHNYVIGTDGLKILQDFKKREEA
jgi:hypothetical protein